MAIAATLQSRIVAGSNRQLILIGPSAQLRQAVDFHRAGIWNKKMNQLLSGPSPYFSSVAVWHPLVLINLYLPQHHIKQFF